VRLYALVLFTSLAPLAAETVAQCETRGGMISFNSPWALSRLAISMPLPRLSTIKASINDRPVSFRVTVDSSGKVIEVLLLDGQHNSGLDAVVTSIRQWTFRPFVYNGRRICMRSTIYVYLRNRQGTPELIISGFTDRDHPPGRKK
jgi:hypothetical protein